MKQNLSELMLPAPVSGGFRMDGYWVWCGSVIKGEDGRFHMFASRWRKTLPMHPGWLLASEVVRASSDTPEGPFQFEEIVLPARGAEYWDGRATHNPSITKYKDTYILYYMGTTHPFDEPDDSRVDLNDHRVISARANKRIGIATAKSVFGPWTRCVKPGIDTRPAHFDNFLTSNPAPCLDENGGAIVVYKSRRYIKPPYNKALHGKMQFGIAKTDDYRGGYQAMIDQPIFGDHLEFEDPFIWRDADGYNMMAKDMNGNISGEKHGGVHALSSDGIHWNVKENNLFYSRKVLWDDGQVREMSSMERPFILFQNGKPTHVYFATADGIPGTGFRHAKNTWNMVIPLKSEE
ncbi:MAG: glycoside hydrolase family protein [Clostridia bacterium]|nr:glycoside hydrolase family protein [Clostridia bacterium]